MSIFYKKLRLIGLSFKTAQISLRESFSSQEKLTEFIQQELALKNIDGAFALSTCNRVEIYYEQKQGKENMLQSMLAYFKIKPETVNQEKIFYLKKDEEVIQHIFKVASSLDSLVIGEPQITSQLKHSYQQAHDNKLISGEMHKFVNKALWVSKKIKSDTDIAKHAVSISYVAVELIKKVFDDLSQCKVLLLGAGEMAELCLKHLQSKNIKNISISNRSWENALKLASSYGASPIALKSFKNEMHHYDIIIASTAAEKYIIEYEDMKKTMKERKNKPVFMVDIAVPRNINPDVEKLEEVYLYNVDNLEKISASNQKIRHDEALKADLLIKQEVKNFVELQEKEQNKQSILSFKNHYKKIFDSEMKKIRKSLSSVSNEDFGKIQKAFDALEKKLIANPINYVKSKPSKEKIRELEKIFNIDE